MADLLHLVAALLAAYVLVVWAFGAGRLWCGLRALDEERRLLGYRPGLALYAACVLAAVVMPARLALRALARLWRAAAAGVAALARRWTAPRA